MFRASAPPVSFSQIYFSFFSLIVFKQIAKERALILLRARFNDQKVRSLKDQYFID